MSLIFHLFQNNYLPALVELWNASARDCHGFFPLTEEIFRQHLFSRPSFSPEQLIVASYHGATVGMLHYDLIDVNPYPYAGAIAALLVHPDYRDRGYAQAMLREALNRLRRHGVSCVDALGAWPYSSYYNGLIDGSERAGPDLRDSALLRIFEKAGFRRGRESLIMRAPLPPGGDNSEIRLAVPENELVYCQSRDGKNTWLDQAFRYWQTYDHVLLNEQGQPLAYAIYARMNGYCEYTGREVYSVYGVNTPERRQRQGFATRNLRLMQARLAALGGQEMEVHVYTDNLPALRLYRATGFEEIGKTVIMRR